MIDLNDAGPQILPWASEPRLINPEPAWKPPETTTAEIIAWPEPAIAGSPQEPKPKGRPKKPVPIRPTWLVGAITGSDQISLTGCMANVAMICRGDPLIRERFTFDEFAQRLVCWDLPWDKTEEPREWRGSDDLALTEYVQLESVPASQAICSQAIERVAHEFPSHPPRDWLSGLEWDGGRRLLFAPQRYFGAKTDIVISEMFKCWLISGVARIFQPGCKVDHVLILEGEQGALKSGALRALLPEQAWFSGGIGGPIGSKDAALSLQGKMIVEIAELSAFKGATPAEIKAWLSLEKDRIRPPYGHRVQDFPRSNIFAGTINEAEYLDDQTGARRYWPMWCGKIDIEAIKRDRDQLWAEAAHLYFKGEKWWLSAGFEAKAKEAQQERTAIDPWAEQIIPWLDERGKTFIQSQGTAGRVTMGDILIHCLVVRVELRNSKVTQRVAGILRDAGWRRWQAPREKDSDGKVRQKWLYVPAEFQPEMWRSE